MQETPSLRDVPLFEHLSGEEREELGGLLEAAGFSAGETLIEEGRKEEQLYILTSGTVEVYKRLLPGRGQLLATIEAPSVVGEMGLLTEPKAAASVVAKTGIEAYAIGRDPFLSLLEKDSPAACKVVYELGRTLAERMAKTDDSIAEIIAQLDHTDRSGSRDLNVFQDKLIREWSF